ncbi:hypothetical protein GO288_01552 [Ralstonia solanacearum]|nr:hypothetical protein [Ralstonia solanacearum]
MGSTFPQHHFEHRPAHSGCSLVYKRYSGTPPPHPQAVRSLHWYAKTRNSWKSLSAFDSIVHHQSLRQRVSLCTPINPARPQAWRGFSLLLADLAPTFRGRFRAFSPPFPLSFSLPRGRAKPKVRKAKSQKISDLGNAPDPGFFSSIGRHLKIGERENTLKSAKPHAFCWHSPSPPPRQSADAVPPNTAGCPRPDRTTRPPRATSRSGSRPGYLAPTSSG